MFGGELYVVPAGVALPLPEGLDHGRGEAHGTRGGRAPDAEGVGVQVARGRECLAENVPPPPPPPRKGSVFDALMRKLATPLYCRWTPGSKRRGEGDQYSRGVQQAKEGGEDRGKEHDSIASREVAANVCTQKDQGGNCDRSPRQLCEAVGL